MYLNGAILGMKREEIARKFDDIVAFAEVERFIDTPVKRYSSGMYLRLAFAVAAFLESEILLVDEVLAVGDASFQKRCLGKMRDVSASGRTVLFVSHNMAAIESLCNRCLYLSDGHTVGLGQPHELIGRYLSTETAPQSAFKSLDPHPGRPGRYEPMMRQVFLAGDGDAPAAIIRMGGKLSVRVDYRSQQIVSPVLGRGYQEQLRPTHLRHQQPLVPGYQFNDPTREGSIACHFSGLPLMPNTYSIDLFFGDMYQDHDVVYDAITFEVVAADVFGQGKLPGAECGPIYWPATWTHVPVELPAPVASGQR